MFRFPSWDKSERSCIISSFEYPSAIILTFKYSFGRSDKAKYKWWSNSSLSLKPSGASKFQRSWQSWYCLYSEIHFDCPSLSNHYRNVNDPRRKKTEATETWKLRKKGRGLKNGGEKVQTEVSYWQRHGETWKMEVKYWQIWLENWKMRGWEISSICKSQKGNSKFAFCILTLFQHRTYNH